MPVKHEDDTRIDALSVYRPPRDPYIGVMPWDRWRRRWKMIARFYRWQIRLLQEENRRLVTKPIVTPSCPHCEALAREAKGG